MSYCKNVYILKWGVTAFRTNLENQSDCLTRKICTSNLLQDKLDQEKWDAGHSSQRSSRSSSSHENYHRRSYERKRNEYQKDKDQGYNSNTKSFSFKANPNTTHYQRLNIDTSANLDAIKSAYYSLSKQYHPDIVGRDDPVAIENFRLITDAYDTLSNPKTKAEYDKQILPTTDTSLDPVYTAWKPQGHQDLNQETVYRMREAHRVFQSKQDEALAREKERNPNRFRSGVFRYDDSNLGFDQRRLDDRINSMNAARAKSSGSVFQKSDGNEFYRVHLYDTLLRKQQDLRDHDQGYKHSHDETLWISLGAIVSAVALLVLTAADLIYDFDLAALLDSKLGEGSQATDVKRK